jgi:hypothetical protein
VTTQTLEEFSEYLADEIEEACIVSRDGVVSYKSSQAATIILNAMKIAMELQKKIDDQALEKVLDRADELMGLL